MTPAALVEEWFAFIEAPKKAFVAIESGGHLTMFTTPDLFLGKFVAILRPVVATTTVGSQQQEVTP
jgi:pimeloyl-ACP methyl ester carboxylesterase